MITITDGIRERRGAHIYVLGGSVGETPDGLPLIQVGGAAGGIYSGYGSPEGVVSAPISSIYEQLDASVNENLWVRTDDAGTISVAVRDNFVIDNTDIDAQATSFGNATWFKNINFVTGRIESSSSSAFSSVSDPSYYILKNVAPFRDAYIELLLLGTGAPADVNIGIVIRGANSETDNSGYRAQLNLLTGLISIIRTINNTDVELARATVNQAVGTIGTGVTARFGIRTQGNIIAAAYNGSVVIQVTDNTLTNGSIGIYTSGATETVAVIKQLDAVYLDAANSATGWRRYAGFEGDYPETLQIGKQTIAGGQGATAIGAYAVASGSVTGSVETPAQASGPLYTSPAEFLAGTTEEGDADGIVDWTLDTINILNTAGLGAIHGTLVGTPSTSPYYSARIVSVTGLQPVTNYNFYYSEYKTGTGFATGSLLNSWESKVYRGVSDASGVLPVKFGFTAVNTFVGGGGNTSGTPGVGIFADSPAPPAALTTTNVTTNTQLTAAAAAAIPGNEIILASGIYNMGMFTTTIDGTEANPIILTGSLGVILDFGSSGYWKHTADYWFIRGDFQVRNSLYGFRCEGGNNNVIDTVNFTTMGQQGILFKYAATNNTCQYVSVSYTEKEGFVFGTANTDTSAPAGSTPDGSITNRLLHCSTSNIKAQSLNINQNSNGAIIYDCSFNGNATIFTSGGIDSIIVSGANSGQFFLNRIQCGTTGTTTTTGTVFFSADAESGTIAPPWSSYIPSGNGGIPPVASTDRARSGTRSYKFVIPAAGAATPAHYSQVFTGEPQVDMGGPSGHFMSGYYTTYLYVASGYTLTDWNTLLGWMSGTSGAPRPISYVGLEFRDGLLQFMYQLSNASDADPGQGYTAPTIPGYNMLSNGWYYQTAASPNGRTAVPRNQWVKLRVHYIMSLTNGRVVIEQDDVVIMDLTAPTLNTFDGASGDNPAGDMMLQFGIYGAPQTGDQILYADGFTVDDGTGTVTPIGGIVQSGIHFLNGATGNIVDANTVNGTASTLYGTRFDTAAGNVYYCSNVYTGPAGQASNIACVSGGSVVAASPLSMDIWFDGYSVTASAVAASATEGASAFGFKASALGPSSLAAGDSAQALQRYAIGLGYKSYAGFEQSLAIGPYATTIREHQVVIAGGLGNYYDEFLFGQSDLLDDSSLYAATNTSLIYAADLTGYSTIADLLSDGGIIVDPEGIITWDLDSTQNLTGKALRATVADIAPSSYPYFSYVYKTLTGLEPNKTYSYTLKAYNTTSGYTNEVVLPRGAWYDFITNTVTTNGSGEVAFIYGIWEIISGQGSDMSWFDAGQLTLQNGINDTTFRLGSLIDSTTWPNLSAGSWFFKGARGTGSGVRGQIIFQTGESGAGSTDIHPLGTRLIIDEEGVNVIGTLRVNGVPI